MIKEISKASSFNIAKTLAILQINDWKAAAAFVRPVPYFPSGSGHSEFLAESHFAEKRIHFLKILYRGKCCMKMYGGGTLHHIRPPAVNFQESVMHAGIFTTDFSLPCMI